MEQVTRPLLRYFGGKWKISPWIISHFPEHRIYCEPFGGGASVLLRKPRSYAEIYNDLDNEIVNVFRQMRDNFEILSEKLMSTPFARSEYDLAYEDTECLIEKARRTVVRSWMGFGNSAQMADGKTGFKAMVEKTGSSNAAQWKSYLDILNEFKERLHGVVIENRDAFEVIEQQDTPDTLFLLDPPYISSTRKSGKYKFEMTNDDHERLCGMIRSLKGMVVLCGYENDIYNSLGWQKRTFNTIAMSSDSRSEVLWLSSSVVNAERQLSILEG